MLVARMLKRVADTISPISAQKQAEYFEDFKQLKALLKSEGLLDEKGLPRKDSIERLKQRHPDKKRDIKRWCYGKDKLVLANLRGAIKQASRYLNFSKIPENFFDDLVSAGCEGLTYALYKYQPGEGTKFSTYAHFWVVAKIRQQVELAQLIKKSSNAKEGYRYRFYTELRGSDGGFSDIFDSVPMPEPSLLAVVENTLTPEEIEFITELEPLLKLMACGGNTDAVAEKENKIKAKVLAVA